MVRECPGDHEELKPQGYFANNMRVYKEFEEKLPFSRMNVIDFWETLLKAHRSSGDNGHVTIPALKTHFN